MKLTNKQHTDYCEIINNFECKAIDTIESLTKEYKNTLAEDIDKKLNDWKTHNEELIIELNKLKEKNAVLENALELACVLEVNDIRMFNEPKEECVKRLTKYYIEQAEEKLLGEE